MKSLFVLFFILFQNVLFSQQDLTESERKESLEVANHEIFKQTGNNDNMYYSCEENCSHAILNISESFFGVGNLKTKVSKKIKKETAFQMLEQQTYMFLEKGFKKLTIKIEGIEPLTKELELN